MISQQLVEQQYKEPKIGDAVRFILKHKTKSAFLGWDNPDDIARTLLCCRNAVAVENGKILGVCIYEPSPAYQTVHINNILCISHRALVQFIAQFFIQYPNWKITGNRRGKLVEYKHSFKFLNKLCATKM